MSVFAMKVHLDGRRLPRPDCIGARNDTYYVIARSQAKKQS